jgi:hypothetical protein
MGKVGFNAFQKKMVTQGFWIDGDELSGLNLPPEC